MDLATLGGLLMAIGAMVAAEVLDHGTLRELISPSALILILGGTMGATTVSFTLGDVLSVPRAIWSAFRPVLPDPVAIVQELVRAADKARREGLLALEDEAEAAQHPLLRRGLALIADGTEPAEIESSLVAQSQMRERTMHRAVAVLESAGGFAPTIGIIGTVMGLVRVLGNMEDPGKLAGAIAVAFLATFYGIATANLLWLPLAAKVKRNIQADTQLDEMVIDGLMSVQNGMAPRQVQEKLSVYLTAAQAGKLERPAAGGGEAK